MGRTQTKISLSGDLTIPESKPDIGTLLRVTATPVIDNTVKFRRNAIFFGHVRIFVEYVADVPDGTQPIHFVLFTVPYSGLINHRLTQEKLKAYLRTKILLQEYQTLDPRTIKNEIALKLFLRKFSHKGKYQPVPYSETYHTAVSKQSNSIFSPNSGSNNDDLQNLATEKQQPYPDMSEDTQPYGGSNGVSQQSYGESTSQMCGCPNITSQPISKNSDFNDSSDMDDFILQSDFHLPISVQLLNN
jgi:hypothetical protein